MNRHARVVSGFRAGLVVGVGRCVAPTTVGCASRFASRAVGGVDRDAFDELNAMNPTTGVEPGDPGSGMADESQD